MDDSTLSFLINKPSAWIPVALSMAVLLTMLSFFSINGIPTRQPDEGTAAHLFQIWLVIEGSMIGYLGLKWLPRKPRRAIWLLILQITAVLAACAPVYYLGL